MPVGDPVRATLVGQAKLCASFAVIRASRRFDPAWYRRQFAVPTRAARLPGHTLPLAHYVWRGRRAGASPHPLFEPAFFAPARWRDDPADPFARLLLRGRTRRAAPHPLFDPQTWARLHPDAAKHRWGPFGHFTATAAADTLLPLPEPLDRRRADLGDARAGLGAALETLARGRAAAAGHRGRSPGSTRSSGRGRSRGTPRPRSPPTPTAEAPVVSVVLPVRDREALVGDAIASVRAQTLPAWELLVVDDGSTDGTADVVRAPGRADPRIRLVVRREPAAGVCAARNAGAAGRPRPLRRVARLRQHVGAGLPGDDGRRDGRRRAGGVRGVRTWAAAGTARPTWVRRSAPGSCWRSRTSSTSTCSSSTRELLAEVGGFDEGLRRTVDYDLVLRLAERTALTYVPFVGVRYRDDRDAPDRISVREPFTWREVVKNKNLIDWAGCGRTRPRPADAALASVLVGATRGWSGAYATVTAALAGGPDGRRRRGRRHRRRAAARRRPRARRARARRPAGAAGADAEGRQPGAGDEPRVRARRAAGAVVAVDRGRAALAGLAGAAGGGAGRPTAWSRRSRCWSRRTARSPRRAPPGRPAPRCPATSSPASRPTTRGGARGAAGGARGRGRRPRRAGRDYAAAPRARPALRRRARA